MDAKLAQLVRDRLGIDEVTPILNRYAPEGYSVSCAGSEALEGWRQLRALVNESGYWPLILGDDEEVSRILGVADSEYGQPVQEILDQAASQTGDQWLKEREESNLNSIKEGYGENWQEALDELHGEWPDRPSPVTEFTIPFEGMRADRPKQEVTIGLFPTTTPWEIPAHLNFGGWNECPNPDAHVLMMKRWFEQYGAELVGMNGDTVEMYASRPPSTREDALKLAREQYLYCEDIVIQGTQTIESLAAGLLDNHIWFFWWD
jgi:hypothetical protein